MIKHLRNYLTLADGAVFRLLQLVPESTMLIGQRIRLHNWKGLLAIRLRYRVQKLPAGRPYVLLHNSYQGYYHWLLESLPRLLEVRQVLADFTLLLPATCTADFYADSLRLLAAGPVTRLEPGIVYRVPDLALVYSGVTMGSYDQATLLHLRQALFEAIGLGPVTGPRRRLYISRRLAGRRRVLNEEEVTRVLAAHGVETVCLEEHTFAQQVQLCAEAELIIGMHGAGLANVVFQPVDGRVIELRKFDGNENIFFSELARTLELRHDLLYCPAQDERLLVQDADLWVNTTELLALLA